MTFFKSISIYLVVVMMLVTSCKTATLYEQNTFLPDHQWSAKTINGYQFNIEDTNSMYKVFFVIRHHNAYHYKNIWIQVDMKAPGDTLVKQTLNLNLADDLNGWLGTGMDDIYDQRIPITPKAIKFHKGICHFSVQHTMREDPLQNILSTGIRVEKVRP